MAKYSKASSSKLRIAHPDLKILFSHVIERFDNTILYGHRTSAEQFELFKKGRKLVKGIWKIFNKKLVVTYKEGTNKKSKHNYFESHAVDATPYPINWDDKERMYYFAGYVMAKAEELYYDGLITHKIRWGGDWDGDTEVDDQTFMDLCHFEII
jgi:peptidoglycan L-alanyl-D-glutamate endopeptidase CwlK